MKKKRYCLIVVILLCFFCIIGYIFSFLGKSNDAHNTKIINLLENTTHMIELSQYGDATFEVDDENIAVIDQYGLISGVSNGSTKIYVKKNNRIIVEYIVNVKKNINKDKIFIDYVTFDENIEFNVSELSKINYTVSPENATERIKFISDSSIIKIDDYGNILGLGDGEAIVTVASETNKIFGTIKVMVHNNSLINISNNSYVTFNKNKIELDVNDVSYTLTYASNIEEKDIVWKSSNVDILTVDNGIIKLNNIGDAKVYAIHDGIIYDTCSIYVTDKTVVSRIEFDVKELILKMGETYNAKVLFYPKNAKKNNVKYSSSNTNVATVEDGLIKVINKGTTNIVAMVDGLRANLKVIVDDKEITVNSISFTKLNITINYKNGYENKYKVKPAYTIKPSNATINKIEYKSSDEKVCKFINGEIIPVKQGTCVATIIVNDNISAKINVYVDRFNQISTNDFLKIEGNKTEGFKYVKQNDQQVILRGFNLGVWLSRSLAYMPIEQINNLFDTTKRASLISKYKINGYTLDSKDYQINNITLRAILKTRFPSNNEILDNTLYSNFISLEDLDTLESMNVSAVRVPFEWSLLFEARDGKYQLKSNVSQYIKYMDFIVKECGKRNIYVIFDLHVAPGGLNSGGLRDNPSFFKEEMNIKAAEDIWGYVSNRYKNNPIVAGYDLLNEPGSTSQAKLTEVYNRLYKRIRIVNGDKHIIFMEPLGTGNTAGNDYRTNGSIKSMPDKWSMNWQNVSYSAHHYFSRNKDIPECKKDPTFACKIQVSDNIEKIAEHYIKRIDEDLKYAQEKGVPLYLGEFSFYTTFTDGTSNGKVWSNIMSYYNARKLSYAAWTYKAHWDKYFGLVYYGTNTGNIKKVNLTASKIDYNEVLRVFSGKSSYNMKKNSEYSKFLTSCLAGGCCVSQFGGEKKYCSANYNTYVNELTFGSTKYNIGVGQNLTITVTANSIYGGNTDVPTVLNVEIVGKSGIVKVVKKYTDAGNPSRNVYSLIGLKEGATTLKAVSSTGATVTAGVTVSGGTIVFGTLSGVYNIKVGESLVISSTASTTIANAPKPTVIKIESANANVAKVVGPSIDPNNPGKMYARLLGIKKGTTVITALSSTGKKIEAVLKVN